MRDAVGNKERWVRRRTPTQDPSTNSWGENADVKHLRTAVELDHGGVVPRLGRVVARGGGSENQLAPGGPECLYDEAQLGLVLVRPGHSLIIVVEPEVEHNRDLRQYKRVLEY